MLRKSLLLFGVAGVAGCALHDWSGYADGVASVASGDSGVSDGNADSGTATTFTGTDGGGGDAGTPLDPYGAVVAADAPIAWYRFEESDGAETVLDAIGNVQGRVQTIATFGVPGVAGHGVTLDGSGGFGMGDVFDFAGKRSFTFEAWLRTKGSPDDQRIAFKRDDRLGRGYVIYLAGDMTPHFEVAGAGLSSWSNTAIPSDAFTHIVVTIAYANGNGTATLWANGVAANNKGFYTIDPVPGSTVPFELCPSCKGTLDEVAIYDHALTEARIVAHYLAGSNGQ